MYVTGFCIRYFILSSESQNICLLYLLTFDVRIIFKIYEQVNEFYYQSFKKQLNSVPLPCQPKYLSMIFGSQSQISHMIFRYLCVSICNLMKRPSISPYLITEYFLPLFIRGIGVFPNISLNQQAALAEGSGNLHNE